METPEAVTIDSVLALPGLGLRLVAGAPGRGNPIRWVHVSEVEDPTPWLRGGELLLTTGMAITDPQRFDPYVRRLAAAGLAGLGFGVDFAHDRAPAPLRAAADATGLPVIEIAVDTPFMAISEAVSRGLSAERHAELGRVLRAQRTLTRAMLDDGDAALLAELAGALGCWAVRTDPAGTARDAVPPEAAARVAPIEPDLRRVLNRRQPSAVSTVTPDEHVMAHPIGARIRGFVVIGRRAAFTEHDRMVLSVAVSLLAVEAEQEHRQRADVLRRVLAGDLAPAALTEHGAAWGLDPDAVRVAVIDVPDGHAARLVDAVDHVLASGHPGAAHLDGTRIHVLTGPGAADALAAAVSGTDGARLALGDVVPAARVPESLRHAELAADVGRVESRPVTDFADLDAFALLLGHVPADALHGYADRLLGDLERHDAAYGTDLLRTLRAFLDADGQWNRAAAALGVHRHTLRARIDRIAELTGRPLGSGYARAGLWLALRARALG